LKKNNCQPRLLNPAIQLFIIEGDMGIGNYFLEKTIAQEIRARIDK
jgi:hypothetical protein